MYCINVLRVPEYSQIYTAGLDEFIDYITILNISAFL